MQVEPPSPMADIIRVTSLKILNVSITNGLSTSGNVHDIIRSSAPLLNALRAFACSRHEQHDAAGHLLVDCRRQLMHAASAWSGFIKMTDRSRVWMHSYAEARIAATARRTYRHSRSSATAWTKNCLISYSQTRIICYQIYSLHLP
jgi:hypothetical protein